MSKQKLKWYGLREGGSAKRYSKTKDFLDIRSFTKDNIKDLLTPRFDMKEYYCKLCGAGLMWGSLHSVRLHALENHNNKGELSTGLGN